MRITSEMMVSSSLRRLSSRLSQYQHAQSQLATGRRILAPSDDPGGTGRALSLRADLRSRQQETRNAADARSWLNIADTQMQAAVDRLHRARDLTVRAANSLSPPELGAIAQEVLTVRDELVTIANSSLRGSPLFAGFASGAAVVNTEPGPPPTGRWVYQGDDGVITRRVGEQDVVQVNVTAAGMFGFNAPGGDVFTLLDDLVAALEGGGASAVSDALGRLDEAQARLGRTQAQVGANTNWVDSALRRSEDGMLAIRGQLAEVEDVEVASAIMELQTQEVAYEATLAALARALPSSLVSFLR